MNALRLVVFDRTCGGKLLRPGLSDAWAAGRHLYRGVGRIDASRGVESWAEALDWLGSVEPGAPIAEVQYWGHGRWGRAFVARDVLAAAAFAPGHALHDGLSRLRARMLRGRAGLFWFRTCETFGQPVGKRFARTIADFLGCRVAGHTYVIGAVQSGLHSLMPGEEPRWSDDEGVPEGHRGDRESAKGKESRIWAPNTIGCLQGRIPEGM